MVETLSSWTRRRCRLENIVLTQNIWNWFSDPPTKPTHLNFLNETWRNWTFVQAKYEEGYQENIVLCDITVEILCYTCIECFATCILLHWMVRHCTSDHLLPLFSHTISAGAMQCNTMQFNTINTGIACNPVVHCDILHYNVYFMIYISGHNITLQYTANISHSRTILH